MNNIFNQFCNLLKTRFKTDIITTEDSIRYTFFAALLKNGLEPHQVVQELPHPKIRNKEIDTFIPNYNNKCYIEFKYDRQNNKDVTQNKTDRAGKFINDLLRLSIINEGQKIFVYLTDEGMNTYFSNKNNDFEFIYHSEKGTRISIAKEFLENRPESSKKQFNYLLELFNKNVIVKLLFVSEIESVDNNKLFLKIYEVT
jgi:hypothetical protein